MQPGDRVMVKVGRDRERGGVLVRELPTSSVVRFDECEKTEEFHCSQVRPDKILQEKGGTKYDGDKNMVELIPVEFIEQVGLALTFGAKKYSPDNWRKGFKWRRLVGATLRHVYAWSAGEDKDPESGLSHLAHAGACLAFLIGHEQCGYGEDDRIRTKNA